MPDLNSPGERAPSTPSKPADYSSKESGRYQTVEKKELEPSVDANGSKVANRYQAVEKKDSEPTSLYANSPSNPTTRPRSNAISEPVNPYINAPSELETRGRTNPDVSRDDIPVYNNVLPGELETSSPDDVPVYNNVLPGELETSSPDDVPVYNNVLPDERKMGAPDDVPIYNNVLPGELETSTPDDVPVYNNVFPDERKMGAPDDVPIYNNVLPGELETGAKEFAEREQEVDANQLKVDPYTAFAADFERLVPLGQRALTILQDSPGLDDKLASDWASLRDTLEDPNTSLEEAQTLVTAMESRVRQVIEKEDPTIRDKRQTDSLQGVTIQRDGIEPIGKGNFGEVYKLQGDNGLALVGKFALPGKGAEFLKEVKHEADVYAKVGEHPNIARCYGIQKVDGLETLVLENVSGGNLVTMFKNLENAYDDEEISRPEYIGAVQHLIKGSLQGLAQFETMGMVHVDIKSDNIMFDPKTNQAKLVDMGLSQEVSAFKGNTIFSANMAPEYFLKKRELNNTTDSFAMGRMLFPLMERDPAFKDNYQFRQGEMNAERTHVVGGAFVENSSVDLARQMQQGQITKDEFNEKLKEQATKASQKTDGGLPTWQAIRPLEEKLVPGGTIREDVKPGTYGVKSDYVDFMNRMTHPDPEQRLSPSAALKHPFMTDRLDGSYELDKVLAKIVSVKDEKAEREKAAKENLANQPVPTGVYVEEQDVVEGERVMNEEIAQVNRGSQPLPTGVYVDEQTLL